MILEFGFCNWDLGVWILELGIWIEKKLSIHDSRLTIHEHSRLSTVDSRHSPTFAFSWKK